jgi:hypothetical protein
VTLPRPHLERQPETCLCYLLAMDPERQSLQEAGAYTMLRAALFDLTQAERVLTNVQEAVPDDERAQHLAAIRAARAQLETFL